MAKIMLNRIYFENYKIFKSKELSFAESLNIFSGPNGYGKTSVFDALEWIITGKINRILKSEVINGKLKYRDLFLANDSRKDVIVKAEFLVYELKNPVPSHLIVAKRVKASNQTKNGSRKLNPQNLEEITETFMLPTFESIDFSEKTAIPHETLKSHMTSLLGESTQSLFSMVYYVQQEDRLDFFKNTEEARVSSIDSLFNVTNEKIKLGNIKSSLRQLGQIIKSIQSELDKYEQDIDKDAHQVSDEMPEYKKLLTKSWEYDLENAKVGNRVSLDNAVNELIKIRSLVNYREDYFAEIKNNALAAILKNEQAMFDILLFQSFDENLENVFARISLYKFCLEQLNIAGQNEHWRINYSKLSELLNLDIDVDYLLELSKTIVDNQKSYGEAQKALSSLIQVRDSFWTRTKDYYQDALPSTCQFCGYDWKDSDKLLQQIDATREQLINLTEGAASKDAATQGKLKSHYEHNILPSIRNYIVAFEKNNRLMLLKDKEYKAFLASAKEVANTLRAANVSFSNILLTESVEANQSCLNKLKSSINERVIPVSAQYLQAKESGNFDGLIAMYFETPNDINSIQAKDIDNKILYLQNCYWNVQNQKKQKMVLLKDKTEKLNLVAEELTAYGKALGACINKYQAQVITNIEIPFYIYSAKILQSYQGGQGVSILSKSDE